jgi:sodium/proline symporter
MRSAVVLVLAALLGLLLVWGAAWGARRTYNASDYLAANRRLNALLTALSYTANAAPAWLLFTLAAVAFAWGWSAIWMAIALLAGSLLNWFYIAPRLRKMAAGQGSLSVLQILGADVGERLQPLLVRSSALLISIALFVLIASELHLVSSISTSTLGFGATATIVTAAAAYALYIAVGGYWAASLADAVVVVALVIAGLFLLVPAIIAAGGIEQLQIGFAALGDRAVDLFGGRTGVVAVAFASGTLGLGLSLCGQPHALNRFIAVRDDPTLNRARWLAVIFFAVVLATMLLCGWCAQVLYAGLERPELALLALATRILPPSVGAVFAWVLVASVLAAVGGQLLVLAGLVAADLKRERANVSFTAARIATVIAAVAAACLALYGPHMSIERSVLAYTLLGAAFGPLVLVRIAGKRIRPGPALAAIWAGAILTIVFHLLPDSPGDFLERVLPFVAALGIALTGGERRRNPDRADRADETVHDRVPI